jgi:ribosomal-protein-alanine N-acetyltransferase
MADDESIFASGSDPEVTRYVNFETHSSIEDARTFIRSVLDDYENHKPSSIGIELKVSGELIGTIGYINWSEVHRHIETGYAISKKYWNQGYITEALVGLINYLFTNSDLIRIEARCRIPNLASARVMEKAGMAFEGILRKSAFAKGEYHDFKMYSIIRDEWERENNY